VPNEAEAAAFMAFLVFFGLAATRGALFDLLCREEPPTKLHPRAEELAWKSGWWSVDPEVATGLVLVQEDTYHNPEGTSSRTLRL
jgi:hypothetical protein